MAALRHLRHKPDSLLHRRRRHAAFKRLENSPFPRSVVFLCHGNICRSPFAAALFDKAFSEVVTSRPTALSAGFIGPGRSAPRRAQIAAMRHGVDLSAHRSVAITAELLQPADLIVVVSASQARTASSYARADAHILVLGDLDPESVGRRTILDPWNGDTIAFDESYDRIDRCVRELVTALRRALTRGQPHA